MARRVFAQVKVWKCALSRNDRVIFAPAGGALGVGGIRGDNPSGRLWLMNERQQIQHLAEKWRRIFPIINARRWSGSLIISGVRSPIGVLGL
jgi:hypothetical protein